MRKAISVIPVLILACLTGCSDSDKTKVEEMTAKIDSLERVNADRQYDITSFNLFIETLSNGLDSIAQQENTLFFTNKGTERTIVDRKQLKKNLEMFQNTLITQRQKIVELTESLKKRGADISKLNSLVNYLNQQLDEKDRMIKQMQADLDKKNVSIVRLKERINTLAEDNYTLTKEADTQKQTLIAQEKAINEAYIIIGTKKELKERGILSSGFLKKTKVNYQDLPKDKFKKIDIRTYKEVTIPSKKVKILTQMPSSSYEMKTDGDNTTLHVTNPTEFWSVTNYLIIQTN
ncbi:MAG: hypothetical protein IKQ05_02200 [Prevotella sp.]|nr:hypothetical protein [Prevotella sp.]